MATTEGEEDHEVSLLWLTAEARVFAGGSGLLSWGSLSRHDILAEECTVGCRWTMLYKLSSPMI